MKCIIADRFARGLLHPRVQRVSQRLAFVLDREINERRGPPENCGASAGFEVVCAGGPAEGHVEVGVHVDATGKHIFSCGIDNLPRVVARKSLAEGGDLGSADSNVALEGVSWGGDPAVYDD